MNSVNLIGRLTRDPEIREASVTVATFTVAVDRIGKDKGADFIRCKAFGRQAEVVGQYLSKGKQVGVSGRIETDSYEKDGARVYTTEVIAERVDFLGGREQTEEQVEGFVEIKDEDLPF